MSGFKSKADFLKLHTSYGNSLKLIDSEEHWYTHVMWLWDNPNIDNVTKMMKDVKTVVDIGANVGFSVLHYNRLLKPDSIIAIEPDHRNFELLKYYCQNTNNVTFVNSGIYYGKTESQMLIRPDQNPAGRQIVETLINAKHGDAISHFGVFDNNKTENISLMELEDCVDFIPDLVKIDVEWSEYNIISNSSILKKAKYLYIEWHCYTEDGQLLTLDKKPLLEFIERELLDKYKIIYKTKLAYLFERL